MSVHNNIGFFEVKDWQKNSIHKHFPDALQTDKALTIENASKYSDLEIVSTFIYSEITREVIDKLPNLKLIATQSTGFDHIDISYAKEKNIVVSNVPEYGTRTVAEHTFALILTLVKKIYQSMNQAKRFDFSHDKIRTINLHQRTIGIIGLGLIGKEVVKIAQGFGMNILVNTRTEDSEFQDRWNYLYTDLEPLLKKSDIISLHLPYNQSTHHMVNKDNIAMFKKGSYLINTARGGLVDTEAILYGLEHNILAGVGLDVLEEEKDFQEELEILKTPEEEEVNYKTLMMDHVLMNHPKVVITPHNAFNSEEALNRIIRTTLSNIKSFIANDPQNLVNAS